MNNCWRILYCTWRWYTTPCPKKGRQQTHGGNSVYS